MRPKLKTFLLSVLCIGLIFGSLFVFKKTPTSASYSYYEPLKISRKSLNSNTIWGGSETLESIAATGGFDGENIFYSSTNEPLGGIEPSGLISLDGIPYQFNWSGAGDYTGNDTVRLHQSSEPTIITFDKTGAYEKLYILGTASGINADDYADLVVTIHYTDNSFEEVNYHLDDWRNATLASGVYKWPNLATRSITDSRSSKDSATDAIYLQSSAISINSKKLISSIELSLTSQNEEPSAHDIYCSIYAITGTISTAAPAPVESIYIGNVAETTAEVHWQDTMRATSYRLDVAVDSKFKKILPDYNNLHIKDTSTTIDSLASGTTYYVRVRAENSEGQSLSSNTTVFLTNPETASPTSSAIVDSDLAQNENETIIASSNSSYIIENDYNTIVAASQIDIETVKTDKKAELDELETAARALLSSNDLTDNEQANVKESLDHILKLIVKISRAISAKDTPAIRAASSVMQAGYTANDRDILSTAKADLNIALEKFSNNYTDDDREILDDTLIDIALAIDDIDNQAWEQIRLNTFPTISVIAETQKWIAADNVEISATDDYGVDKLEYSNDGGQTWRRIAGTNSGSATITQNGTYIFRATNEFSNTATKTIEYHNIDPVTPVVFVNTHGYVSGSWTNQPVTISAEVISENPSSVKVYYRLISSLDDEGEWFLYNDNITILTDTDSTKYEFKAISEAGVESAVERVEIKKDTIVPTGTISVGEDSFNNFLNTITFGLFFNETKSYTLSPFDDNSGIKTIEYIISEIELGIDELMTAATWKTTDGTVSIDPNKSPIVYYRLTDNASNISVVTLSDVVFDLPGLSDINISIESDDSEYSAITIGAGRINLIHDLEHTTVDDLGAIKAVKDQLADYLEKHPDDTSGIVNSILADYNHAISAIEDTETAVATIASSYNTVGDIDHVTSKNKERITSIIATITETEGANGSHLTTTERQTLNNILNDLYAKLARIIEIQQEYDAVDRAANGYDISTVNKDDLDSLTSLKNRIDLLLGSANATDEEKEYLRALLTIIENLEKRITEAEKAIEDAKEHDHASGINPDNVTPDDQTALQDASNAYAQALGVFDSNLTLSDLFDINNRISIINSALDILDQVAEFEALISRLPNPEDVDYDSRSAIKAAEEAYNALSEYGRTLVGPSLLARYQAVLDAYRAYLEGSPLLYAFETLDIFWWGIATCGIICIFVLIVRHTHKQYIEEIDDIDDF